MTLADLMAQVEAAFAAVPMPTESVAPDQYPAEGPEEVLQGRARDTLSDDEVWEAIGNINLHLLSPAAMRYYWPRFVRFALERPKDRAWEMLWHMLYVLSRGKEPHKLRQFGEFDSAQRESVRAFLDFVPQRWPAVFTWGGEEELREARAVWGCRDVT